MSIKAPKMSAEVLQAGSMQEISRGLPPDDMVGDFDMLERYNLDHTWKVTTTFTQDKLTELLVGVPGVLALESKPAVELSSDSQAPLYAERLLVFMQALQEDPDFIAHAASEGIRYENLQEAKGQARHERINFLIEKVGLPYAVAVSNLKYLLETTDQMGPKWFQMYLARDDRLPTAVRQAGETLFEYHTRLTEPDSDNECLYKSFNRVLGSIDAYEAIDGVVDALDESAQRKGITLAAAEERGAESYLLGLKNAYLTMLIVDAFNKEQALLDSARTESDRILSEATLAAEAARVEIISNGQNQALAEIVQICPPGSLFDIYIKRVGKGYLENILTSRFQQAPGTPDNPVVRLHALRFLLMSDHFTAWLEDGGAEEANAAPQDQGMSLDTNGAQPPSSKTQESSSAESTNKREGPKAKAVAYLVAAAAAISNLPSVVPSTERTKSDEHLTDKALAIWFSRLHLIFDIAAEYANRPDSVGGLSGDKLIQHISSTRPALLADVEFEHWTRNFVEGAVDGAGVSFAVYHEYFTARQSDKDMQRILAKNSRLIEAWKENPEIANEHRAVRLNGEETT